MSLNTQVKWNALRSLGYSGTQEDMELSFYLANGATSYSLRDAEMQFLTAKGYTLGVVEDKWKAYLLAQGFVGAVDDMMVSFWNDVADILVDNLLLEDGNALLQETGSFIVLE
jgi:hypothetical protein